MVNFANFTEEFLEEAVLEILTDLGYETAFGPEISVTYLSGKGRLSRCNFKKSPLGCAPAIKSRIYRRSAGRSLPESTDI